MNELIAKVRPRLPLIGWALLALPAVGQLFLLMYTVLSRVTYPYDLEWMEGGLLTHAQRFSDGYNIYAEPSMDFIPYLYTPLYPALLSFLGGIFGLGYTLGRVISILSMVGIMVLMVHTIVRDSDKRDRVVAYYGGAVAIGFFAAAYPWFEGWYDLVRADTLFLFMVIGGLILLRAWANKGTGWRGQLWVAVPAAILGLSFFCKQTGVLYVAAGGPIILLLNWRRVPIYVGVTGVIGLGGTWILDKAADGWFWTYIYEVHQAHDFNMDRFYKSFELIMGRFRPMTITIVVGLLVVGATAARTRTLPRSSKALLLWAWIFAVSVLVGMLGWATQWAHFNAYMPAMTTGAIAAGAAVVAIVGCASQLFARPRWLPQAIGMAVAVTMSASLMHHWWKPKEFIPTDKDRKEGAAFIAELRKQPGPILVPFHPWYAKLAGKELFVHRMGVADVSYRHKGKPSKWKVRGIREKFRSHFFKAVYSDNRQLGVGFPNIKVWYHLDILPLNMRPRTYTGAGRRYGKHQMYPSKVYVAKDRVKVLFGFERGRLKGWQKEGSAWGNLAVRRALKPQRVKGKTIKQGSISNHRGGFVTSYHGGDAATGTLVSPEFTVSGSELSFRVSGGSDEDKLRVELRVGDKVVRAATNPVPTERMTKITWDTRELVGKTARVALIDNATGSWGHLNVDEFWVWLD